MKKIKIILGCLVAAVAITSCQKMSRPALGTYPTDANPPGGPLKFYVAFDGTTSDALMNGVDSAKANFPSDNPFTSIPGISGKAAQGVDQKIIKYSNSNGFTTSSSFAVSFWEKHNGASIGEAQFVFSIPSNAGHWSGGTMFLIFDNDGAGSTADLAVLKFMVFDQGGENWFELSGANRMPGVQDNQWHHIVFSYDEASSNMSVYKDGTLFKTLSWAGHGKIRIDNSQVTGFFLGGKCVSGWGQSWIGGLDQFRLYGKALSAAEVQSLYNKKL
jgi:hypothetical protein